MVDVLLVSMPFGHLFSPSLALSLLQPQLQRQGLTCDVLYLTLAYAELIGQRLYSRLANDGSAAFRDVPGEWLFSDDLFDRPAASERQYVNDILIARKGSAPQGRVRPITRARLAAILGAKRRVPEFLDVAVDRVAAAAPKILGFTSVFQQHVASLALAKRVKARCPEIVIVFGGANCEGVMGAETLRQFPFVDAVVSGEGDLAFPDAARRIVDGTGWSDLPGIVTRQTVRRAFAFGRFPNTPVVADLDALPHPDYTPYFKQYVKTRFADHWKPTIYVETSRGCWWGERMHCTFCGLNGATMAYRSKSADRAFSELKAMAETYRGCSIQVVDNILDLKYFATLLPMLASSSLNLDLFYETKSNLKKEQVRLLRAAGVNDIQPGIESLSNQVLRLMKKGVSALQNIQLLKWCKEFGVEPHWNFIFGFPGESPSEYERMADLAPLLSHLPAPKGIGRIRLDRFSPNFFDAPAYGFTNVRPLAAYEFIYDVPDSARHNLAYYFAYDCDRPMDVNGYVKRLEPRLKAWRAGARRFELLGIDDSAQGVLTLVDTRRVARAPLTVLTGVDRHIYLACDAAADVGQVARAAEQGGWSSTREDVAGRLRTMVGRGIMVEDEQRFLSLGILLGSYMPRGAAAAGVMALLSRLGKRGARRLRVPLDRMEYRMESRPPHGLRIALSDRGSRNRSPAALARTDFRLTRGRELTVRVGERVD